MQIDADTSESQKIDQILKGIAEDAFQLLLMQVSLTVVKLSEICRYYQRAKQRCIQLSMTPYASDNVPAINTINGVCEEATHVLALGVTPTDQHGTTTSRSSSSTCMQFTN